MIVPDCIVVASSLSKSLFLTYLLGLISSNLEINRGSQNKSSVLFEGAIL